MHNTAFAITLRAYLAHESTLLFIISSLEPLTITLVFVRFLLLVITLKKIKIVCCDRYKQQTHCLLWEEMPEEYRDRENKQYMFFVNFDKAFDRITTNELECGRLAKKDLPKAIVRVVMSLSRIKDDSYSGI